MQPELKHEFSNIYSQGSFSRSAGGCLPGAGATPASSAHDDVHSVICQRLKSRRMGVAGTKYADMIVPKPGPHPRVLQHCNDMAV